jgi:hypothetical protein
MYSGGNAAYLHPVKPDTVILLMHTGCDAHPDLCYEAGILEHNYRTGEVSAIRPLAKRSDFADGPAKEPRLRNVVFPSALIWNSDGTVDLYAGLSDASIGRLTLPKGVIST